VVPARLDICPYDFAAAVALERELGVSHVVAQVLARRGLTDPAKARTFLEAEERHSLDEFPGLKEAAECILAHVQVHSHITVHGDYDADGVCSTAILVRVLRTLGAEVDWYLPSRTEDGYGLSRATIDRLQQRGTRLLITADCAITAVEEVAAARAAGMDVVVTDHHTPRADGALPDALIVHPRIAGHPCPDLCAAGVAYKVAGALLETAGLDPKLADEDLDLVALATVADVVPLTGENRALVRAGLRTLAATKKPGLRALMKVAKVDPSGLDAGAIGFRLAPRINAAGRIARADAAMELLLTSDPERAAAVAEELDSCNAQRRDVETRILFEAEAQVREAGEQPAYVLAADGWHPGVIGIIAARIAERHFRPTVLIALDGEQGTGSGRSIPGFDLLAGLNAGSDELLRHGGHKAAAGLTIARNRVEAFREAFVRHAAATLTPEDLQPVERVDAVVNGDALGLALAEDLERLAPFGMGNPTVNLLVPAAVLEDPRPLGDQGRHVAFSLAAGGARSRAVRFGEGVTLPDGPVDAAVRLEKNVFNGTTEPRLVLRHAIAPANRDIEILGEPESYRHGVLAELDRDLDAAPPEHQSGTREIRDVLGRGAAGVIADLVATREPVLVVTAHAHARADVLRERLGGFAIADYAALEDDPGLASRFAHLVALDPPAHPNRRALLEHAPGTGWTHLAWGPPELAFAQHILQWELALREPLAALYRALRAAGGARGEECEVLLRGDAPQPRTACLAGRLVRVLTELRLAVLDREGWGLEIEEAAGRTDLERSPAFRAYSQRLEDGHAFLTTTTRAQAA
jgi:single-stranded-DNA-specific exonuclease